eukprot:CAMPEP_0172593462 /NCGR_PEP_ID=MMETSP1068-20121228/12660_1 /TAXON_ID=35684 /ORGANISM="Pseudopedinella elastica, Strain CCMP716" /LENGTH=293 /DNA_ID=CAMNT_0013390995 /DNA_START=129 /DNA_END=1010 /DNA_ORIENTATION=-
MALRNALVVATCLMIELNSSFALLGPRWQSTRSLTIRASENNGCTELSANRRVVLSGLTSLLITRANEPALAAGDWEIDLAGWKVTKKLDSVVRIQALTVLSATYADLGLELTLRKVPLGASAASTFDPNDQFALASVFATQKEPAEGDKEKVVSVMMRSLESQANSQRTTLRSVKAANDETPATYVRYIKALPQRYVRYGYESHTCRRLDQDGGCEGKTEARKHLAVVTVGLETQARTLAERQAMEDGEMEGRQIDVLWLLTISAPVNRWKEAGPVALLTSKSFSVNVDEAL